MNSFLRLGFSSVLEDEYAMSIFTVSESESLLESVKGNLDLSCEFLGTPGTIFGF